MALYTLGTSAMTLTHYDYHSHEYWEVILNIEGTGTALIGNTACAFSPGTVLLIPPNVPHSEDSADGFRDIYFHTDVLPGISDKNTEGSPYAVPSPLLDDADGSLKSLLTMMLRYYFQPDRNDLLIASLYQSVLLLLGSWLSHTWNDPVAEQLKNRFATTFTDPEISITAILEESGYAADYIRRRFCRATGMTPGEYVARLRIDYAKQLLTEREQLRLSVSDIGMMCGYYDSRYFARAFRKATGVPPSDYSSQAPHPSAKTVYPAKPDSP